MKLVLLRGGTVTSRDRSYFLSVLYVCFRTTPHTIAVIDVLLTHMDANFGLKMRVKLGTRVIGLAKFKVGITRGSTRQILSPWNSKMTRRN